MKYFKEIKRLKSLQKAEAYLEREREYTEWLTIFTIKAPYRCSIGLYIGHPKCWHFQIEVKAEQTNAIVTTRSLSCLSFVFLLARANLYAEETLPRQRDM